MIAGLFYLFAIFYIITCLRGLFSPREKFEEDKLFASLGKEQKGKTWQTMDTKYKSILKTKLWSVVILFWVLLGMFTSQWDFFVILLAYNILIFSPLCRLTRFTNWYMVLSWVNALLCTAFGVFIIINKYHLHIQLFK